MDVNEYIAAGQHVTDLTDYELAAYKRYVYLYAYYEAQGYGETCLTDNDGRVYSDPNNIQELCGAQMDCDEDTISTVVEVFCMADNYLAVREDEDQG